MTVITMENHVMRMARSIIGMARSVIGMGFSIIGMTFLIIGMAFSIIGMARSVMGMVFSIIGMARSVLGMTSGRLADGSRRLANATEHHRNGRPPFAKSFGVIPMSHAAIPMTPRAIRKTLTTIPMRRAAIPMTRERIPMGREAIPIAADRFSSPRGGIRKTGDRIPMTHRPIRMRHLPVPESEFCPWTASSEPPALRGAARVARRSFPCAAEEERAAPQAVRYAFSCMTSDEARRFAARWAEAWNKRDLERVLAHFHEDVEFTSPTALAVMGTPTLRGRKALREYWTRALAGIGSLRFTVDRVVWDPDSRELAIIYTSEIDGRVKRVSENLTFNPAGQVVAGDVFHGAAR